jgi:pilus assembly protein CpaE
MHDNGMSTAMRAPESTRTDALGIVLIVPDEGRRRTLAAALAGAQAIVVREFTDYPNIEAISQLVDGKCDVVVVETDANADRALELVENICSAYPTVTVMIYTSRHDTNLLVRCMRAGAREVLTDPIQQNAITFALARASARPMEVRRVQKVPGKSLVFVGSKGGAGVTTVAANFAVHLARESGCRVAFVDMDLYLGDAALNLGIKPKFTMMDALQNEQRLDIHFLETLLFEHESSLMVLAAPEAHTSTASYGDTAGKVLRILKSAFDYVVVDGGAACGPMQDVLLAEAKTIYLVTEVSIPALRSCHLLIPHLLIPHLTGDDLVRNLEVVLNRYDTRQAEIDECSIAKALTVPPTWKVPNDHNAVRHAQNNGSVLASEDTAVSRSLRDMARAACGKVTATAPVKKKRFGLFG